MAAALDALGDTIEGVIKGIQQKWRDSEGEPGILDSLRGFAAAVNWREPWLCSLLAAQALVLLSIFLFRRSLTFLCIVFFAAVGIVYNAERLNGLLHQHWEKFAGQPYFDAHGVFTSTVLSAPLLLDMLIILVILVLQSSQLLIKVKRKELRYNARQRHLQENPPESFPSKKTS
ncbi:hypothetical protein WJX74_001825 [Apatococcus lobatus]|uniref:Transmembrane protein 18 n=1 Tax=Apatococcus lobatus TaxID=904363 RepID=A0AAW1SEX5_9CHLO